MTADSSTVEVEFYWRPGCGFCLSLRSALRGTDLTVREVNIWEDPEAAARVRSVADGNEVVPTVFVGDEALVNPSASEVVAAHRRQSPDAGAS
ncbi:glutaredoxin family protein [Umezawaea beigongshangensis]|uniref:glutaredoxin family protein n=1 Tax=Umezawaea beigongshangensis TaxID=2780383 RepID=UPI0018F23022|nr:glutaredoxin domain-containing protein [Umezawaea beigongshangensis]